MRDEQRKVARSFAFYCLGIFLCWSAFVSLFNLQSSINIEAGLGMTTIATSYMISSILSIVGVPIMIKKFGVKKCMIIGDAVMLPYILANLYPRYYTLLPAGILMAIAQAPMWPSMSLLNVSYATQYAAISKRPKDVHVISFSGYFFTVFQASQVFGNLLSYVILYGFDQSKPPGPETSINCTSVDNASCTIAAVDYSNCGTNDCQNSTIINEAIEQYKPVNHVSLYVLVGITILLEIVATLLHIYFVPSEEDFEKKTKEYKSVKLLEINKHCTQTPSGEKSNKKLPAEPEDSKLIQGDSSKYRQIDEKTTHEPENERMLSLLMSTTKSVFRHFTQLKLALILPLTLYNGLAMGFAFTELTRAFASCILGVEWVGICMACYGLTDAILSWVVGKFGRRLGRVPLCIAAVLLEAGNYFFCLIWSPESNVFLLLGIFFAFGVTDGIFQTFINVTHIDYFPQNPDTTVTVWNVIFVFGFSVGYALSIVFCVRTRIWFNIVVMCLGTTGLVIAETLHRKENSKQNNNESKTEDDISIGDPMLQDG